MSRLFLAVLALTGAAIAPAKAESAGEHKATRLHAEMMIVDRNTGRVVYDDGRDDLFCVTRRVMVGQTQSGAPVYRRTMRCR